MVKVVTIIVLKKLRKCTKIFRKAAYRDADKSLAPPEGKQATATEYFEFHISYL
jgi:hypothetical protein